MNTQKLSEATRPLGRPRIPIEVRLHIVELARRTTSARELRILLEQEREESEAAMEEPPETRARVPSLRSIESILAEYRKHGDEEASPVDLLHPDAMGLPLDSLRFLLRMTQLLRRKTGAWRHVLTQRHARWIWWVRQAAPDLPLEYLQILAGYLSTVEQAETTLGASLPSDWVVDFVAYNPWSSKDALDMYHEDIRWGRVHLAPEPESIGAFAIWPVEKDVKSSLLNLLFPAVSAIKSALKEIEAESEQEGDAP